MLKAYIILVCIWGVEMRIDNGSSRTEAGECTERVREVYVMINWLARKRIGITGRAVGVAEKVITRDCGDRRCWKTKASRRRERNLTVELKIILRFEDIIK